MNTQVMIISSQDPPLDAEALVSVFCETKFVREHQENESIVLIGEGLCTFFLIKGDPNAMAQVLVVSGDHLRHAVLPSNSSLARVVSCQRIAQSDDMTTIAILELPGSSRILLTTPVVLETKRGRETLMKTLTSKIGEMISKNTPDTQQNGKAIMEPDSVSDTIVKENMKLPEFPTLDVSVLSLYGRLEECPVNTPTAVPFETDLFVGNMMLILRPEDPTTDPYWNERLFSKKKRRFVFQLQGKFKRKPRGIVYAGAEISDQMKIGLVAKGMCSILLNLVRSFNPNVHYSFGDKTQEEKSHIVIPAWTFFERLVVTKAGDSPPAMGEAFPESQDSINARKSSKSVGDWNIEDTYSMSYYSMYIDLPKWKIVKVPVAPEIDLRTFWNKSFLSIVLYENETPSKNGRHLAKDNSYFFALKMKFHPGGKKQENEEILPWKLHRRLHSESNLSASYSGDDLESNTRLEAEGSSGVEPTIVEESDGEEYYFDAEESDDTVINPSPLKGVHSPRDSLTKLDTMCPMSIEMCSKGKYVNVYAFVSACGKVLFRTPSTVAVYFNLDATRKSVENAWSPRLSNTEKARRMLSVVYLRAQDDGSPHGAQKLVAFQQLRTEFDLNFLQRPRLNLLSKRSAIIRKSCFVARALSDYHWVEEWVKISEHQIAFYHPERLNDTYRMSLRSIVKVEKMSPEACPNLPSFSFMAIESLGRTIYLMFASERECDEWVVLLTEVSTSKCRDRINGPGSQGSKESSLMSIDDPSEEFLHKSSMWICKQRRILNCRKFCFSPTNRDPITAVQFALTRALEPREDSEEENLRAFLNSASFLKEVNVNELSERERLAFFLNLYHVMIMHAFLVLGPPNSSFQWISYFNTISYQCSDEIFSLTELEHNIIRASMNYPSNFVSKFVLPKSQYRFALTQSDFRINFALNCGSLSNPGAVPMYRGEKLEQQLDASCRNYLNPVVSVVVKRGQTILTLPRICQWFADDFGSCTELILHVKKYLKAPESKAIEATWSRQDERFTDLPVKYLPYSFECRHLTLLDDGPMFTID